MLWGDSGIKLNDGLSWDRASRLFRRAKKATQKEASTDINEIVMESI